MAQVATIGVDVGGTFTDFVLARGDGSALVYHKEPSTPSAPARAVVEGFVVVIRAAGLDPSEVGIIAHGTTIGLNAILQRRAAPTALVVSRGSRDILELGRCKISDPLNFFSRPDAPLVPRTHVVETALRLDRTGVCEGVADEEADRVAEILRGLEVEAYAVALINAYLNPAIETGFAKSLAARLGREVTASCGIWPEIREYERAMVAVMNAAVSPLMQSYLGEIESGLTASGFRGRLLITTSNGGTLPVAAARRRPVDTLLSGPAAGVVAAAKAPGGSGPRNLITVDMGGTSSDMSVVTGSDVEYSNRAHIGDFPLFMPVVSVSAIGAGGGSIVRVDRHGVLKVGPESAGADPGPIAYGRGGTQPTLTDCFLVCGYLARDQFLGGSVGLSYAPARAALEAVGAQLGLAGADIAEQAAWSAIRVATAKMATELRKGLAERGIDQNGYALMPFGGAGPVQAALLAKEARISTIVVPEAPGTFCAMGAMLSDLKRDFSRTVRKRFGGNLAAEVRSVLAELRAEADAWLDTAGDIIAAREHLVVGALRYGGQSYDLPVVLAPAVIEGEDAGFVEAFHDEHSRRYGFADREAQVALIQLQLTASGRLERTPYGRQPAGAPLDLADAPRRPVFIEGGWQEAAVLDRRQLPQEQPLDGPAIINQKDTTSLVPAGWRMRRETDGAIVLTRITP